MVCDYLESFARKIIPKMFTKHNYRQQFFKCSAILALGTGQGLGSVSNYFTTNYALGVSLVLFQDGA
jgi:hypothetical protein